MFTMIFYETDLISDDGNISLLTKVIETRARCIVIVLSCIIFYFTWQFLIGIEKVRKILRIVEKNILFS